MDAEKRKQRDAEIIRLMRQSLEPEAIARQLHCRVSTVVRVLDRYIWVENVAKKFRARHAAQRDALQRKRKRTPEPGIRVIPIASLPVGIQHSIERENRFAES